MMYFILGIIVGILVRDIKVEVLDFAKFLKEIKKEDKGRAQFFEGITFKDKFKDARGLGDIINDNTMI